MRGRRGIVLVAVLLGGVALLLVVSAALTAALVQAQGAAWSARAQRARAAARGGIVLVDAVLEREVARSGAAPEAAPALPTGHGLEVTVLDYRRIGPREVEVEVEGRADGATARAGARLAYR
jgi:hypothetical protein